MQEVLLAATQSADAIIQERLNGINFGRQYVAQKDLLQSLSSKNSLLGAIHKDMQEVTIIQANYTCMLEAVVYGSLCILKVVYPSVFKAGLNGMSWLRYSRTNLLRYIL